MKIVSPELMSQIDSKSTSEFGLPGSLLMENAGIRCWDYIEDYIKLNKIENILIVAGSGNNGGDALVIARYAWNSDYKKLKVVLKKEIGSELFQLHKKICNNLGIPLLVYGKDNEVIKASLAVSGIIIDGITGTGLQGPLRSAEADLVNLLNASSAIKIAIDIPSGLGEKFEKDYPVVHADITLTIGLPKTILYYPSLRFYSGKIEVVKIGFPPSLLENPGDAGDIFYEDKPLLPNISPLAYKGTRGHTVVYGGSKGTVGAGILSASAAGRARSGLVTLCIDSDVYKVAASHLTSIMVKSIDTNKDNPFPGNYSSILAGPGWGTEDRSEFLEKLFDSNLPGVLDADGLNLLKKLDSKFTGNPGYLSGRWVFTPHPGEYARITGIDKDIFLSSPISYLRKTSAKYGVVLVLKSHVTFIVTPSGEYTVVDGMNPSLGTGGSGDILSGIIAGLLAQGMESYEAAVMGVSIHQNIGKRCFKEKGWFLAEDLLPYISIEVKNMGSF